MHHLSKLLPGVVLEMASTSINWWLVCANTGIPWVSSQRRCTFKIHQLWFFFLCGRTPSKWRMVHWRKRTSQLFFQPSSWTGQCSCMEPNAIRQYPSIQHCSCPAWRLNHCTAAHGSLPWHMALNPCGRECIVTREANGGSQQGCEEGSQGSIGWYISPIISGHTGNHGTMWGMWLEGKPSNTASVGSKSVWGTMWNKIWPWGSLCTFDQCGETVKPHDPLQQVPVLNQVLNIVRMLFFNGEVPIPN